MPIATILLAALAGATPATPPVAGTMPVPGDDLAAFFAAMDRNGDGTLSRAEFDGWFGGGLSAGAAIGGSAALKELGAYFAMMDADHDGRVTRPEFTTFHDKIDRSGEGE